MNEGMKKLWAENKATLCITSAVVLLPMLVGLMLWNQLPQTIITSFDMNNQPSGQSSRMFTVLGMPLLMLALHLTCAAMSCSPSHKLYNAGPNVRRLVLFIIPAISLLIMTMTYSNALGIALETGRLICVFVGVVFIVMGFYLPKIRYNRGVGIRLPWTLVDEENWNMTHKKAGPVWMAGGLGIAISGWLDGGFVIPIAVIIAMLLIPAVYSCVTYIKKHK